MVAERIGLTVGVLVGVPLELQVAEGAAGTASALALLGATITLAIVLAQIIGKLVDRSSKNSGGQSEIRQSERIEQNLKTSIRALDKVQEALGGVADALREIGARQQRGIARMEGVTESLLERLDGIGESVRQKGG